MLCNLFIVFAKRLISASQSCDVNLLISAVKKGPHRLFHVFDSITSGKRTILLFDRPRREFENSVKRTSQYILMYTFTLGDYERVCHINGIFNLKCQGYKREKYEIRAVIMNHIKPKNRILVKQTFAKY